MSLFALDVQIRAYLLRKTIYLIFLFHLISTKHNNVNMDIQFMHFSNMFQLHHFQINSSLCIRLFMNIYIYIYIYIVELVLHC